MRQGRFTEETESRPHNEERRSFSLECRSSLLAPLNKSQKAAEGSYLRGEEEPNAGSDDDAGGRGVGGQEA